MAEIIKTLNAMSAGEKLQVTASVIAKAGYECPKILTPKDALEV